MAKKNRIRHNRRDRRKAKESEFSREGTTNAKKKAHHLYDGRKVVGSSGAVTVDREAYERDLRKKRAEHLRKIASRPWEPCLHDQCQNCFGTGVKVNGEPCIHMISCPCPACNPVEMKECESSEKNRV